MHTECRWSPLDQPTQALTVLLRAPPEDQQGLEDTVPRVDDWAAVLDASFQHAVAGVILARLPPSLPDGAHAPVEGARRRQRVETLRHSVFRNTLQRILGLLARERIPALALKGPLLAARYYSGIVRPSTDLDILVEPSSVDATVRALTPLGYRLEGGEAGRFFRDHHHHVHLLHPTLPTLELHVDAYQGFGTSMPAAPLLARSVPCTLPGWTSARLMTPEDEFLYLSVHAASHRFQRLGWLYDLKLLLAHHPELRWDQVADRATDQGLLAAVTLTCTLLSEWLGVRPTWSSHLPPMGSLRARAAQKLAPEKGTHLADAAAAFLYSSFLCDDARHAMAFATRFFRVKLLHELPMRVRSRLAT